MNYQKAHRNTNKIRKTIYEKSEKFNKEVEIIIIKKNRSSRAEEYTE